jgi:hypothetical protein
MKLKQAATFLENCERSLRKLVADAAAEGDYASVERITALAKAVGALAGEASAGSAPVVGAAPTVGTSGESAVRAGRRAQARYPRFFRRGEWAGQRRIEKSTITALIVARSTRSLRR